MEASRLPDEPDPQPAPLGGVAEVVGPGGEEPRPRPAAEGVAEVVGPGGEEPPPRPAAEGVAEAVGPGGEEPRPGPAADGVAEVVGPGGEEPRPRPARDGVAEVVGRAVDDHAIARTAGMQRGRVTAAQLREAGLGATGASRRAKKRRLLRVHRGVYAVGHAAKPRWADEASAVLAAGEGAFLGHRSALELWG